MASRLQQGKDMVKQVGKTCVEVKLGLGPEMGAGSKFPENNVSIGCIALKINILAV